MSKRTSSNAFLVILRSLGWPIIGGLALCAGFYVLVLQGVISHPLIQRYFTAHLVEYIETAMFCVGLTALAIKLWDSLGQYSGIRHISLGPIPPQGQKPEESSDLLDALAELPPRAQKSYLGKRLQNSLELVERKGTAEGIEEELKYLADNDAAQQYDSYSLVRIIIWATPMLGFLGTVIGITLALANLGTSGADLSNGTKSLLSGLSIAFDTTALALTMSILLMFIQFLIDRVETQLLVATDMRAVEELIGRFELVGGGHDPHVAAIHQMSREVLKTTDQLVERQSQLWETTINAAHDRWNDLSGASGEIMLSSLSAVMDQTLEKHVHQMAEIEQASAEQMRRRWEQWQVALSDNSRVMLSQQKELVRQGEVMTQAISAVGEVKTLERALNENLQTLSGAKNFEDTVMSLAAAIHLLNTRLGSLSGTEGPKVDLNQPLSQERAA